jgi:hypothetical protein
VVSTAPGDFNGSDFPRELVLRLRRAEPLLRPRGPAILRFARDLVAPHQSFSVPSRVLAAEPAQLCAQRVP